MLYFGAGISRSIEVDLQQVLHGFEGSDGSRGSKGQKGIKQLFHRPGRPDKSKPLVPYRRAYRARRQTEETPHKLIRVLLRKNSVKLATLREHHLPARRIEFEITESMVMHEPERAVGLMHELRSAGIGLALDDFGTGYSSLAYLKRFPLTHLKIDRSFVQGLPDDPGDPAMTSAVIALARSLSLNTVAEGVESAKQRASLRGQGCGQAQGDYFSRPLTDAALVKLLGASRLPAALDFNTGLQPA